MQTSTVTFCGGVGQVTGAHTVVDTGTTRFAIDCGLVQGDAHVAEAANAEPLKSNPPRVQFLFVTHAHADHIGRIGKFVKEGFSGTIYSTLETKLLAELVMHDAVRIMKDQQKETGVDMLYDESHVTQALSLWETIPFHREHAFGSEGIVFEFVPIGHILGAGAVRFTRRDETGKECVLVVSGDIGNSPDVLLPNPELIDNAHYLVTESVYGDRLHGEARERTDMLRKEIIAAEARGGTLLIPSFAVHRTQSLLFEINNLFEEAQAPIIPVYLDSPLGSKATDVYRNALPLFNDRVQKKLSAGDDIFSFPKLSIVASARDSRAIEDQPGAKIIIAGSGMSVGGRVLLHESHLLSDPKTTILFVGYQTPGTLGRRIQERMKHVTIHGKRVRVRAHIATISGYSGHADKDQLLAYAAASHATLKEVFVIMGEPRSASFLAQRIQGELGVPANVPDAVGQQYRIAW